MPDVSKLPRTIELIQAGEQYRAKMNEAAAIAVASFVSDNWVPDGIPVVVMLDQTKLPQEEVYVCTADWRYMIDAIKQLVVRGAPAIGIAGACALCLRASEFCYAQGDHQRFSEGDFDRVFVIDENAFDPELYRVSMSFAAQMIENARPTAVNLAYEVNHVLTLALDALDKGATPLRILELLCDHVQTLIAEDERICRVIGRYGATLLQPGSRVLTHCNAGSLATAFYGTALGVIYAAAEEGKIRRVYADETRPVNQGARLTVWELAKAGVSVTLICDDMSASLMAQGMLDAVIVGADRIAANGDTANKIGTLGVAVLARHFDIPFYVAAPCSTIDFATSTGSDITIEQRDPSEVMTIPLDGVEVINPAFDITPAALITAIITEKGIFRPNEIGFALRA